MSQQVFAPCAFRHPGRTTNVSHTWGTILELARDPRRERRDDAHEPVLQLSETLYRLGNRDFEVLPHTLVQTIALFANLADDLSNLSLVARRAAMPFSSAITASGSVIFSLWLMVISSCGFGTLVSVVLSASFLPAFRGR